MKKSKFTEEQIAYALLQVEGGSPRRPLPAARHQRGDVLRLDEDVRATACVWCGPSTPGFSQAPRVTLSSWDGPAIFEGSVSGLFQQPQAAGGRVCHGTGVSRRGRGRRHAVRWRQPLGRPGN
jgi:hypothetical protein